MVGKSDVCTCTGNKPPRSRYSSCSWRRDVGWERGLCRDESSTPNTGPPISIMWVGQFRTTRRLLMADDRLITTTDEW